MTDTKRVRSRNSHKQSPSASNIGLGSLTEAYGYLFRRAHSLFVSSYVDFFEQAEIKLTPVLGAILMVIDDNPGLSQIELARLMGIEGATMWQNVARLSELGYIERKRQTHDQRAFILKLNKRGQEVLILVRRGMREHQQKLLAVLSSDEQVLLKSMLLRLIDEADRCEDTTVKLGG